MDENNDINRLSRKMSIFIFYLIMVIIVMIIIPFFTLSGYVLLWGVIHGFVIAPCLLLYLIYGDQECNDNIHMKIWKKNNGAIEHDSTRILFDEIHENQFITIHLNGVIVAILDKSKNVISGDDA